jgi:hypothetical protein
MTWIVHKLVALVFDKAQRKAWRQAYEGTSSQAVFSVHKLVALIFDEEQNSGDASRTSVRQIARFAVIH